MEAIARDSPAGFAAPPVLVFPDWDVVEEGFRPFPVYRASSIDGFGSAIEQEPSQRLREAHRLC